MNISFQIFFQSLHGSLTVSLCIFLAVFLLQSPACRENLVPNPLFALGSQTILPVLGLSWGEHADEANWRVGVKNSVSALLFCLLKFGSAGRWSVGCWLCLKTTLHFGK